MKKYTSYTEPKELKLLHFTFKIPLGGFATPCLQFLCLLRVSFFFFAGNNSAPGL